MSRQPHEVELELGSILDDFTRLYVVDSEELQLAYSTGLIVVDSNVLLDLYRVSETPRSRLLALLERFSDRLFVPHQVAMEVHRERLAALKGRERTLRDREQNLHSALGSANSAVDGIASRAYEGGDRASAIKESIGKAFAESFSFLDEVRRNFDLGADDLAGGKVDPVMQRLQELLVGRVGRAVDPTQRQVDVAEGLRRVAAKIPPGIKDREKGGEGPAGDYLAWLDVLRRARKVKPPFVVMITSDVNEDDWSLTQDGVVVGPNPMLSAELLDITGAKLLLRTTEQLLSSDAALLGESLPPAVSEEFRNLREVPTEMIRDAILSLVRASPSPVVSSRAASEAHSLDQSLPSTRWRGAGSFISFVRKELPELEYQPQPQPGYLYDPTVHDPADIPAAGGRSGHRNASSAPAELFDELQIPMLSDDQYRHLFEALAVTDGQEGAIGPYLAERGISIDPVDVTAVARYCHVGALGDSGPYSAQGLAARFVSSLLREVSARGLEWDDQMRGAAEQWAHDL
jgi:predicted nucleic acid-binding protein